MSPVESGAYLRLTANVDEALAGLEAMRAAAEDARVHVLALARAARAAAPPSRVARRAERRRVTRQLRAAARARRTGAAIERDHASITRGDAWVRGGGPTHPTDTH